MSAYYHPPLLRPVPPIAPPCSCRVADHPRRFGRFACRAEQSGEDKPNETPAPSPAELGDAPATGAAAAPPDADLQLPPAVVARLRETVFSLDTLFVRSVENDCRRMLTL